MSAVEENTKAKRERSPAYPYLGLATAMQRLATFDEFFKRHPAPFSKVGLAWEMKPASSQATSTIAALKAFGLVDYEGSGNELKVSLSADGRNYLRTQQDEIKRQMLRQFALKPKAIATYFAKWGAIRPIDAICLDDLVLKGKFSPAGAEAFLKVYDATIAHAGLVDSDKVDGDAGNNGGKSPSLPAVKIGDYVLWESQGVLQFKEPRRVISLSDDGEYAVAEGSPTGMPVKELSVAEKPADTFFKQTENKLFAAIGAKQLPEVIGMRQEVFSMTEGSVTIQWPAVMSKESFEDFQDWWKILERKIKRSVNPAASIEPSKDGKQTAE